MKWIGTSSFTTKGTRGFSLTELAIVLAVAGIILGGIWVVAASGWENSRQAMLKTDLSFIVKNVRAFYGSQSGISGTFAALTPTLATLSPPAIPADSLRTGGPCALATCADHPWGASTALTASQGSLGICAWNPSTTQCVGATTQFFAIELDAMPDASCIEAVLSNSGADAPSGLYDVVVNGVSIIGGAGVTHQLPPLATDLQKLCTASSTIDFVYRIVAPQS